MAAAWENLSDCLSKDMFSLTRSHNHLKLLLPTTRTVKCTQKGCTVNVGSYYSLPDGRDGAMYIS